MNYHSLVLKVINYFFFYFGWGICLKKAAAGEPFVGAYVVGGLLVIHLLTCSNRLIELFSIILVALIGTIIDTIFLLTGFIQYQGLYTSFPWIAPIWITSIWVLFGMCLNSSLSWLRGHWIWAGILGAGGAFLSYLAGAKLGAAKINTSPTVALLILSSVWIWLFPFLLWFSSKLHQLNGDDNANAKSAEE